VGHERDGHDLVRTRAGRAMDLPAAIAGRRHDHRHPGPGQAAAPDAAVAVGAALLGRVRPALHQHGRPSEVLEDGAPRADAGAVRLVDDDEVEEAGRVALVQARTPVASPSSPVPIENLRRGLRLKIQRGMRIWRSRRAPLGARRLTDPDFCGTRRWHLTMYDRFAGFCREGRQVKSIPLACRLGLLRCSAVRIAFTTSSRIGRKTGSGAALSGRQGPLHWAWIEPSGVNVAGCSERSLRSSCWTWGLCNGQKMPALAGRVVT
jgi:hypothetical protein